MTDTPPSPMEDTLDLEDNTEELVNNQNENSETEVIEEEEERANTQTTRSDSGGLNSSGSPELNLEGCSQEDLLQLSLEEDELPIDNYGNMALVSPGLSEISGASSSSRPLFIPEDEPKTLAFFEEIIQSNPPGPVKKIAFIVVSHSVYDLKLFLKSLEKLGRIARIIFKESHPNIIIQNQIKTIYPNAVDPQITKKKLNEDEEEIIRILTDENAIKKEEKVIFIDIGGYFSSSLITINKYLSDKVIGIVEDTQNGELKYIDHIKNASVPVISVANCEVKRTEDYNVGKAIGGAADHLLKNLQVRIEQNPCGVIGFGKIGSSIAEYLRQKRAPKLFVHDRDPLISMRAASTDFTIATREEILAKCSIIFSATGQRCLSEEDLEMLEQPNVYIISCTSSEDEFKCNVRNFKKDIINEHSLSRVNVSVYTNRKGVNVKFIANGNAVNFSLENNALGNYIRSVQAAILVSVLKLIDEGKKLQLKEILRLSRKEEEIIARIWLKHFSKKTYQVKNNFLLKSTEKQGLIREQDIRFIENSLKKYNFCWLHGENGVGKTQIAKKVAQENESYYDFIWYVDGANSEAAFDELSREVGVIHTEQNFEAHLKDMFAKLIGKKSFFIIFDNIEANSTIKKLINIFRESLLQYSSNPNQGNPYRNHVICISSNGPKDKQFARLISPLTCEDAAMLIPRLTPALENHHEKLFTLSKGYPYLLDKIVCYLEVNRDQSPEGYANNLAQSLSKKHLILSRASVENLQEAIFEISLNSIKKLESGGKMIAYELLLFSALLDGECLHGEIYEGFFVDATDVDYSLRSLTRYGFMEKWSGYKKCNPYYMRKLTQDILLKFYMNGDFKQFFFRGIDVLSSLFHYEPYQTQELTTRCHLYVLHLCALIRNLYKYKNHAILLQNLNGEEVIKIASMLCQLGNFYLYEYRNYSLSFDFFHKAKDLLRPFIYEDSSSTQPSVSLHIRSNVQQLRALKFFELQALNGYIINDFYKEKGNLGNEDSLKQKFLMDIKSLSQSIEYIEKNEPEENSYQLLKVDILITLSYIHKYLGCCFLKSNNPVEGMDYLRVSLENLTSANRILTGCSDDTRREHKIKLDALAHHAIGSLLLELYKHKNVYVCVAPKDKNLLSPEDHFLAPAVASLKSAVELREKCLEHLHPDLARSRYKYSEALWRLHKYNNKTGKYNVEKLSEADSSCQAAIAAQTNSLAPGHSNLRSSLKLKDKIKESLDKIRRKRSKRLISSLFTPSSNITPSPAASVSSGRANSEPAMSISPWSPIYFATNERADLTPTTNITGVKRSRSTNQEDSAVDNMSSPEAEPKAKMPKIN